MRKVLFAALACLALATDADAFARAEEEAWWRDAPTYIAFDPPLR